jgi:hypothetical protein
MPAERRRLTVALMAMGALPTALAFHCSSPLLPMMAPLRTTSVLPLSSRALTPRTAVCSLRSVATTPEDDSEAAPPTAYPDFKTPQAKGKERLLRIQNGSFSVGILLVLMSAYFHYFTYDEGGAAGPLFKTGGYTFFVGVILQYSETYSRCAYIRFAVS